MVKIIFSPHYIFQIQEILINKILDFLPLKVIHDVKYSCQKPEFTGKIEINKIMVFTNVCLAEFFLSGNLQKFIHAKLKICKFFVSQNFLQYYSTNIKTGKSELIFFFENFPCASSMSKLLQVYLITYAHFVVIEHC